jgi:hypothetical protein
MIRTLLAVAALSFAAVAVAADPQPITPLSANPCLKNPCDPHASCKMTSATKYTCTCNAGYKTQGKTCVPGPKAPIDCKVSDFGPWTACENGMSRRTRTIVQKPVNGGKACPATMVQNQPCGGQPPK